MTLLESEKSSKRRRTVLPDDDESITNLTKVSLIMAKHLFSKQEYKEKNVVFSPLSLQVVLSIIAAGSEGPTQQQLLKFLRFESTDHLNSFFSHLLSVILTKATPSRRPCHYFLEEEDAAAVSIANGVWVEQTISLRPSFKQIVSSKYKATLTSVDFKYKAIEVIKEVNLWAKKETNGLIKDILPPGSVGSLTKLIFANALYFKGVWNQTFHFSEINENDFHLLDGSLITVPFMTSSHDQYIEAFDDFKVLCLPYKQGEDKRQFSMYIFLPNAKYGLPALVKKVASNQFELLEHNLPLVRREVNDLRIPRFKFSFDLETSHMLKELGVILPFSPGGLTEMVDSHEGEDLYVSKIFQKSFIEVNEKGTKAATTSTSSIDYIVDDECDECDPIRIDFIADHPFLFLIREVSTRTILFAGQVLNPLFE